MEFLDGLNVHGLTQSVNAPTRGDAILDLVLSCGGDIETCVSEGMFKSDHRETCSRFYVRLPFLPKVSRTTGFNYRAADFNQFRAALRCLPWCLLKDLDVDSATELFYDLVDAAISDYIPTVSRSRRFPPWFDRDVQCLLRAKNNAHRLKKSQPSPDHDLAFSRARSEFKEAASTKYRAYLLSLQ